MTNLPVKITDLIQLWKKGDREAESELLSRVYLELKKISSSYLNQEQFNPFHLQTTDLVNEAYIRFLDQKQLRLKDRHQFFAIVARLMRQILVDFARQRRAEKRGGGIPVIALDDQIDVPDRSTVELSELDDALKTFEKIDARKCRIVELRYFGGLGLAEIAEILNISVATVKREYNMARAWLYRYLLGK